MTFFANFILFFKFVLLVFLNGFCLVIAHIIFFNSNIFLACLEISKWTLCEQDQKFPPRFQFLSFFVLSYFLVLPLLIISYLYETSCHNPTGPRGGKVFVEMPTSPPKPNSPPSAN